MSDTLADRAAAEPNLLNADLVERSPYFLKKYFGIEELFPHQLQVLNHVSKGEDCLVVVPTGGGKSLCYLLPALMRPGLVVIVSPLIALIRDQVAKYRAMGIPCAAMDSLQDPEDRRWVWEQLEAGDLKALYLSPERLASKGFRDRLKKLGAIQLIAIDEAHCISQWGHNFRPEYRKLGKYLAEFSPVQKIALTATATSKVKTDIIQATHLIDSVEISAEYMRDNLTIKVVQSGKTEDQYSDILQSVLSTDGAGIVYAPTRKRVIELYRMLQDAGVAAGPYHAGIESHGRQKVQSEFISGKLRVVVATNAFGLGIDKADIRFVFHAGMPASLEQYVQEIGRAGRDGLSAKCYMFYGGKDYYIQKFIIEKSGPVLKDVKTGYLELKRLVEELNVVEEDMLYDAMLQKLGCKPDDLRNLMHFFLREGLVKRSTTPVDMWEQEYRGASFGMGESVNLDNLVGNLELQQQEQLAKLKVVHNFIKTDNDRVAMIRDYFDE